MRNGTWASVQLPGLRNISLAQSRPLTNGRPYSVVVTGRQDGIQEHAPGKQEIKQDSEAL